MHRTELAAIIATGLCTAPVSAWQTSCDATSLGPVPAGLVAVGSAQNLTTANFGDHPVFPRLVWFPTTQAYGLTFGFDALGSIYFQRADASGQPKGPAKLVASNVEDGIERPALVPAPAVNNASEVLVTFHRRLGAEDPDAPIPCTTRQSRSVLLDDKGNPLSPEAFLSDGAFENNTIYSTIRDWYLHVGRRLSPTCEFPERHSILSRHVEAGGAPAQHTSTVVAAIAPAPPFAPLGQGAYDCARDQYLVVWRNQENDRFIEGHILDPHGAPIGSRFRISTASDVATGGVAAFDPVHDRYVIVYATLSGAIRARMVTAAGAPVGSEIDLGDDSNGAISPRILRSKSHNAFVLVWMRNNVRPRVRALDLSLAPLGAALSLDGQGNGEFSEEFTPTLAENPGTGEVLVGWVDERLAQNTGEEDVFVQIVRFLD
jgi:hypothetical protein